jgi:hypothetical protein
MSRRLAASLTIAFVALTFGVRSVSACDPCGTHASVQIPGLMNAMRTTGLQAGAWTVSTQEQLSTFDIQGENDLRTTETDLELIKTLSVTQLSVAYNVSSEVALQINTPFIIRSYDHFERYRMVRDTESGLGDISLLSTWSPYSYTDVNTRVFVAAMAGVKLPTGDTGSLKRIASVDAADAATEIQGRGLTLGTGSVDVPLGLVSYLRRGKVVLFTGAQYTIRTEGAADYQFANDLNWSLAPGWLFVMSEDQNLTASVVFSGENKGSDHLDGELLPRTASNNLYLGPELFYSLNNRISVQLAFDLPVATDVGGAAVKPETRSRASVSWSF